MSFTTVLAINLAVLAALLLGDLGRKAVTGHRLRRPLIVSGIVGATCLEALPHGGNSLTLVILGGAVGVVLGLIGSAMLRVDGRRDADGRAYSVAGAPYAAFWIAIIAARLAFSWGADHWFTASLTRFCIDHQLTAASITDAMIVMALAMVLTRTATIAVRAGVVRTTAAPSPAL